MRAATAHDDPLVSAVTFAPLPEETARGRADAARADRSPVRQVVQDLRPELLDLARRARRIGPLDTGTLVLLAGCSRGAGCSTLALALAAAAAEETSVLVIDADMKNRGLSRAVDDPVAAGWEEAVRGQCSFEQPLRYTDVGRRVALLPLRQPVADPAELLARPAFRIWLPLLRQHNGLVVIDGGPVAEGGDAWSAWADVALLVCDARRPAGRERAQGWDRLEEGGTHVLGVVETFV